MTPAEFEESEIEYDMKGYDMIYKDVLRLKDGSAWFQAIWHERP